MQIIFYEDEQTIPESHSQNFVMKKNTLDPTSVIRIIPTSDKMILNGRWKNL